MGMWGYLHRLPAPRLSALLLTPDEIEGELYPNDDVKQFPKETVEKTWNAIEFILDRLAELGRIPWIAPLTQGEESGASFHYGPCWYRSPDEVRLIADAMIGLSKDEFKKGYMPDIMAKYKVYPDIWDRPEQGEHFEYVWVWYAGMVKFYRRAAENGEGMLLHLG
jgi:hypothetical protein